MKILSLKADRVKRIQAVEIDANGSPVVVLGGNNGQGKSSVLDSIVMGLSGGRTIPSEPVRDSEGRALIEIDLGDYRIRRTINPDRTGRVEISDAEGKALGQREFDSMIGSLAVDPLAFLGKSNKEQAEELARMVGLDLAPLEAERKRIFEERTGVRRVAESLRSAAEAAITHDDAPSEEPSAEKAQSEFEKAQDAIDARRRAQAEIEDVESSRAHAENEAQRIRDEIDRLTGRVAALDKAAKNYVSEIVDLRAKMNSIPTPDIEAARAALNSVVEAREKWSDNARAAESRAKADAELSRVAELTAEIERLDAKREEMIATADMPVSGLTIDGGVLRFNGFPFDQASSSERLRVSLAMGCALNPALRVLFIRDGSLLDDNAMREVYETAKSLDAQVWIERVGDRDEGAFVIEDGAVRKEATTDA